MCICVEQLHPTYSQGHIETVATARSLEKPGIKPVAPGLQGRGFIHYTTVASSPSGGRSGPRL